MSTIETLYDGALRLYTGDCRAVLAALPERSAHLVVTSPPYFGLRDYKVPPVVWGGDPAHAHAWGEAIPGSNRGGSGPGGKNGYGEGYARAEPRGNECACGAWRGTLGNEPTPDRYVRHLVEVFQEVWRVLRDDGTVYLNLGDSYCSTDKWGGGKSGNSGKHTVAADGEVPSWAARQRKPPIDDAKPKDLLGIPWMAAFALRADGWYLREEIIWAKDNCMPESVRDRCTRSHEHLFRLAKAERYFHDADAIAEPAIHAGETVALGEKSLSRGQATGQGIAPSGNGKATEYLVATRRNKRDVWRLTSEPFPEAHFAVMPTALVEPCILAGTSARGGCRFCGAPWERILRKRATGRVRERAGEGLGTEIRRESHGLPPVNGTFQEGVVYQTVGWAPTCRCPGQRGQMVPAVVLDPFGGAGTVALVAHRLGRHAISIDVGAQYVAMQERRLRGEMPLFA